MFGEVPSINLAGAEGMMSFRLLTARFLLLLSQQTFSVSNFFKQLIFLLVKSIFCSMLFRMGPQKDLYLATKTGCKC